MKTVLVISDLHCGHRGGLCPPAFQMRVPDDSPFRKFAVLQRETWNWFSRYVCGLNPDVVLVNGDCIEGKGERSGGTELWTADRDEQADAALRCIQAVLGRRTKRIHILAGTPYHSGSEEDFERQIADRLGASFGGHEWIDVNGHIFDVRHAVNEGSSVVSMASLLQERMHNVDWSLDGGQPLADTYVRSHAHRYQFMGRDGWQAVVTPGMQWGSKFGSRKCSKRVTYGAVLFNVISKESAPWVPILANLQCLKARVSK